MLPGCSGGSGTATPPTTSPTTTAASADAINRLLAVGIREAEHKQLASARTTFRDVLSLDPGNKYAWYNLGLIAQTQKDRKTAIADYGQALRTDPKYTSAMYNQAIALEPTNRQQALSLYRNIVAIDPKAATTYLRMSFLYDAMGKHDDAVAARDKATALDSRLGSVSTPTT